MHFEVLVEDQSGCAALDILLEKMLGRNHGDHSWRTHAYKGLGHIPRNLHASRDPSRRMLLSRLPELIRGYGNSLGSDRYLQDSICGTWEVLADAVHPGGSADLKKLGWGRTGAAKREWATRIAPHMDPDRNISKSFQVFRDGVRHLAGVAQTGGGR